MDHTRVPRSSFSLDRFLAASRTLTGDTRIEFGIAALPDSEHDFVEPADSRLGFEGLPGHSRRFVPFTAFPWDEPVQFDIDGVDSGDLDQEALRDSATTSEQDQRPPILCADGLAWNPDDETGVRTASSGARAPWWRQLYPAQLGYVLKVDGDDLVVQAGVLVTEVQVVYSEGNPVPYVESHGAWWEPLKSDQIGSLHDRFWAHLTSFVTPVPE